MRVRVPPPALSMKGIKVRERLYRLTFLTMNKVEVKGIDQPEATLHHGDEYDEVIVLKVPGRTYNSGGILEYVPTEFQVYRNDENETDLWTLVVSFPVRRQKER